MRTHEEARKFDTELAALHAENESLTERIDSSMSMLHIRAGDRRTWVGRKHVWTMRHDEVLAKCRALIAEGRDPGRNLLGKLALYDEMTVQRQLLVARIDTANRTYAADPWPRFILCLSHDGHIHRYAGCSTLRWDSRLQWHPELSGLTSEAAVDALGPILCSVCYPDAPVTYRRNPSEWKRERNAETIAARRTERDAAKYAKRLLPEEEIRFHDGFSTMHIETVAACKETLRREVEFRDYYGQGEHPCHQAYVEVAPKVIELLLAREARLAGTGATQAEIDKLIESAIRKNRKDGARI